MKWLITGGCGFIGTGLVRRLIEEGGHRIRVVDNLSVGTLDNLERVCSFVELPGTELSAAEFGLDGKVQFARGDILDEKLALAAAAGAEVIIHLAANSGVAPSVEDPRSDCESNVIGTLNYLEAARRNGARRFVFASSGAPVGNCEPPIHEEIVPHPVSPYGASKLAGEGYCSAYFRTYGVETVVLRFGNVYGPGSAHKNSVVAKFIRQALDREPLEIYGDGSQTRDFIYIEDLVDAILRAAVAIGVAGEVFQIATSTGTTLHALVAKLVAQIERGGFARPPVRYGNKRPGDVPQNFFNSSKAQVALGWRARTTLDEGLAQTVSWFIERRCT